MTLPTFLFGNLGTKYPYCVKVVSKFPPQKILIRSKQHWKDRIPEACRGYDTQSDALDRAIAELFFSSFQWGKIYICIYIYMSKIWGWNRCMIIKDNVIAYQNASCHIHNQQNILISYCHHFKYIQTSKSLFVQTLTFFPKNSSSVTWPHAPRFHATRWIQKSWRQWRDVRPLFEARSWHVGTWNSFGRMMKNDGPISI